MTSATAAVDALTSVRHFIHSLIGLTSMTVMLPHSRRLSTNRSKRNAITANSAITTVPTRPPHHYTIDFPRLMASWKKQTSQEQGASWRDQLLIKTDMIGRLGSLTASLTNWALSTPWIRGLFEKVLGLARNRQVLSFAKESFPQWWKKRKITTPSSAQRKVVLFPGCIVNYQATDIGKATIQVLETNGVAVVCSGKDNGAAVCLL